MAYFTSKFEIGDFVFCNPTSETVEITQIGVTAISSLLVKVTYCVKRVTGPEYWVQETDLSAINPHSTSAPAQSNGTYTVPTGGTFTYSGTVISTGGTAGSVTFTLPQGFTLDPYAINDLDKEPVKCECGAEKVGSSSHSSWCDKHDSLGLGV